MRPTEFRQTRQLLRLTQDQLAERLRTTRRSIIRYEDEGMSGADAGLLWNRWRHGRDQEARARLLAYNEADCVNLEPLADLFFCQMVQRHGFPTPEATETC